MKYSIAIHRTKGKVLSLFLPESKIVSLYGKNKKTKKNTIMLPAGGSLILAYQIFVSQVVIRLITGCLNK
jgi:hypothetical protein